MVQLLGLQFLVGLHACLGYIIIEMHAQFGEENSSLVTSDQPQCICRRQINKSLFCVCYRPPKQPEHDLDVNH